MVVSGPGVGTWSFGIFRFRRPGFQILPLHLIFDVLPFWQSTRKAAKFFCVLNRFVTAGELRILVPIWIHFRLFAGIALLSLLPLDFQIFPEFRQIIWRSACGKAKFKDRS